MKNLLILSVFIISQFINSDNLTFIQNNLSVEDGVYKAKFEKESVSDNVNQRPFSEFGEVNITIEKDKIIDISSFPLNQEQEQIIRKLIGTQLNFKEKGIATSIKVSEYFKNSQNDNIPGKWVYYSITVKLADKI